MFRLAAARSAWSLCQQARCRCLVETGTLIRCMAPSTKPRTVEPRARSQIQAHQEIAAAQGLVLQLEESAGSPVFLPHGTRIFDRLLAYMRAEYEAHGYQLVMTPQIYKKSLWETSGHWQNYKEHMFTLDASASKHEAAQDRDGDAQTFGLKPMNCPGHCLIFASELRDANHLPIRLADFSALHRNEPSGTLNGLTRTRRFHQDDAHIFCREDQVSAEIRRCLEMIKRTYSALHFTDYTLSLSTRPADHYIGTVAEWAAAENALKEALMASGVAWNVKPGDGAFYGPKIDVHINDAFGRTHQTATIQLDFQLPQRFDLKYRTVVDGVETEKRPVIVHRAVLGSVERMMAILAEHHQGNWPFWVSPRQAMVCPVNSALNDYAGDCSSPTVYRCFR